MNFIEYLIYFVLKILSMLPRRFQFLLGRFLGFIFFSFVRKRKEIAKWNLEKCFPEKDSTEINSILKSSFYRLGESLFEFLNAFWMSDRKLKKLILNFDDVNNVCSDMDNSKGKLILFMHNPNLDMVVRASSLFMPVSGMAKQQKNKIVDNLFKASREKFTERIFNPKEILELMNFLKKGKACLYAPDQDYGYKNSIFVDFFGNKALTVKFPYIAVRRTNCDVYLFSLEKKNQKYFANFKKLNILGKNLEEDLRTINLEIEGFIRKNPDNYLWSHRRFKNRPVGEKPFYPKNLLRKR
jgi:lauroyl/myristoyl acyltransferase